MPAQLARSGRDQRSARRGGGHLARLRLRPMDHISAYPTSKTDASGNRPGRPVARPFSSGTRPATRRPPGPPRSLSSRSETTSRPRARRSLIIRHAQRAAGQEQIAAAVLKLAIHAVAADRNPPPPDSSPARNLARHRPPPVRAAIRTDRPVTSQHAHPRHESACTSPSRASPRLRGKPRSIIQGVCGSASDCVAFRCSTNTRSARFGWSRRSRDRGGEPRPGPCAKLPAYASPLLLYAQEIEPHTGRHLGTSQAFSHLALINACVHLIREDERIAAG